MKDQFIVAFVLTNWSVHEQQAFSVHPFLQRQVNHDESMYKVRDLRSSYWIFSDWCPSFAHFDQRWIAVLGLFTLFLSPEDAVSGKTLEHYSSHYSTELGLKNSVRKDFSSNLCTSELMQVLARKSFWKQLAWEAQSPTANSLRLPASAFA